MISYRERTKMKKQKKIKIKGLKDAIKLILGYFPKDKIKIDKEIFHGIFLLLAFGSLVYGGISLYGWLFKGARFLPVILMFIVHSLGSTGAFICRFSDYK